MRPGPGGPTHPLIPLADCTGMQMSAGVTSGGKSSAIFSFWPSWEEGTGSRGGVHAPRRGSRRARGGGGRGPRRGGAGRGERQQRDAAALRAPSGRYAPGPATTPPAGPAKSQRRLRPVPPTPAAASRIPRRSSGSGFAARTVPVVPPCHVGPGWSPRGGAGRGREGRRGGREARAGDEGLGPGDRGRRRGTGHGEGGGGWPGGGVGEVRRPLQAHPSPSRFFFRLAPDRPGVTAKVGHGDAAPPRSAPGCFYPRRRGLCEPRGSPLLQPWMVGCDY